jgi:hypothetical protein
MTKTNRWADPERSVARRQPSRISGIAEHLAKYSREIAQGDSGDPAALTSLLHQKIGRLHEMRRLRTNHNRAAMRTLYREIVQHLNELMGPAAIE